MVPDLLYRNSAREEKALMFSKLPLSFYRESDAVSAARNLLGKALFTRIDGHLTGGLIIETESYAGINDKACHAYNGRRTARTEVMYSSGGAAYIHLCYGIHHMLNAIVSKEGDPQGVLIRAIKPLWGIETILRRRNKKTVDKTLTNGPGALTQALGIAMELYGTPLDSDLLWIAESGFQPEPTSILIGPRIGIDYAGEDALLPYRFRISKLG